jgi:hypothetical protein
MFNVNKGEGRRLCKVCCVVGIDDGLFWVCIVCSWLSEFVDDVSAQDPYTREMLMMITDAVQT